MSAKPIEQIVGRQDGASADKAPETGAAVGASDVATQAKTSTGETPASVDAAAAAEQDPIHGLKSALGKERERADRFEKDHKAATRAQKQLEQRLAAMDRELAGFRANATKRDPKVEQDQFYGGPTEYIDGRFSSLEEKLNRQQVNERSELSRELARDRHEDFDDVEAVFIEAAQKDQSLWAGVLESRLPALVVYKKGKQLMSNSGAATVSEDRIAKLEAEIASLRAGRDGGQTSEDAETATATQRPSIPKSNVGARSSGAGKATSWAGPTPAENVWGRRPARS